LAKAKAINLKVSDLPTTIRWATSPAAASPKAELAVGKKAVACIKKRGPVSPDPFGTSGVTGGVVVVDVGAPTYFQKGRTLTHLPSATSEVVFLKTAPEALADLVAIGRGSSLACLAAQLASDSALQGAGKVKAAASFMSAPRHGAGKGGIHIRFLESGGNLGTLKIYDDVFYYVQGPAEISLTFINLGSAFGLTSEVSAISKVMARAKADAG
jgi:hypothetical protein